ncbi:MAG TPA: hypothetical protein VNT58_05950 [Gaiellaceae bacterium]|nr:hypothetical protein [Gaiellaceae bacterium]
MALASVLVALTAATAALAAPPQEVMQPTLEGTFRQGSTITLTNGRWANNPTSFAYRWLRCDGNGQNCTQIANETSNRYRLRSVDVGRTIVGLVTARNADGATTANTKPSPVIAANVVPQNTSPPTISGTPVVGSTLTASPGTWTGAPNFAYTWLQCDPNGNSCTDTGARGRTYGVRSEDVGRTIRVQVRASNPRGQSTATSAQTGVVRASASSGPAIPVSAVSLPDRLVISSVSFTPRAIPNRVSTITLRVRVSDTRGRLIQGAAVLATGIPFGRVTATPETVTNGQGVATFTFRPTAKLPMVRGASVVFFLRARKPGENPLAGVSTRRLIQITVRPA